MSDIKTIRREVATIANRLQKKVRDLSRSFKRAWAIVKGKMLICKAAGVTFGNRQIALKRLEAHKRNGADIKVTLKRDVNNAFDENAVGINISVNGSRAYQIGYIPQEIAHYLAAIIDKIGELNAKFVEVVGGYEGKPTRGCRIAINLL